MPATTFSVPESAPSRLASAGRFLRHYAEMVIVMLAGMMVLGGALLLPLAVFGVSPQELRHVAPALVLLGMGFSMTAPMVWWMRRRGHSPTATAEMSGAMIVPTLAVTGLLAGGAGGVDAMLEIQHVVMLPAMLAVMLLRRKEYSE